MRKHLAAAAFASTLVGLWATDSRAEEVVIDKPHDHPSYRLEVEPHGLIGFGRVDDGAVLGAGLRLNFVLVDPFIKTVNNNIAIGVGGDLFFHRYGLSGLVPLMGQWNFFVLEHFSIFGEGGLGFGFFNGKYNDHVYLTPLLALGGRIHLVERIAITLRVGYPALSVGLSFFL
jgi:hypothetical protein